MTPNTDDATAVATLAGVLLDETASPEDLRSAANALHERLLSRAGLGDAAREERALPSGKALAPVDAARCATDFARTAAFLRGTLAAVEAARARGVSPVEVLYAGCGPLAPLVLPLVARLPPGSIRCTLLDVHEAAVAAARRLVGALSLSGPSIDVRTADATRFDPERDVDVLVVEALQRSLAAEPHVAIVRSLAPRLSRDGVVVPERVGVDLVLTDGAAETARLMGAGTGAPWILVGTVYELTRSTALDSLDAEGRTSPVFLTMPAEAGSRLWPMLVTSVDVFGPHRLRPYDSGITYPEIVHALGDLRAGDRVAFRYATGPRPRIVWEVSP